MSPDMKALSLSLIEEWLSDQNPPYSVTCKYCEEDLEVELDVDSDGDLHVVVDIICSCRKEDL